MNQWKVNKQTRSASCGHGRGPAAHVLGLRPKPHRSNNKSKSLSNKGGAVGQLWLLTKPLGNRAEMPSERANAASACHHDQILKENRL